MLTRRQLIARAGLGAVALGAETGILAGEEAFAAPRRPFRAYGPRSYFQKPVTGIPVNKARTRAFRAFMKTHPDQRGIHHPVISGVGGDDWGMAYAMGTRSDPIWRLTGNVARECSVLERRGFHAPEWLRHMLTGTDDSPFCVIDRASGFTVYGASAVAGRGHTIHVSNAGITYHSSNGLTAKSPLSNDRRNFTSRGRITDAMVIRRDLVDYGVRHHTSLGHVLHMFFVETEARDGFRHPMVGCESGNHGFGAEGERIAIRRGLDLTRRGLSPEALVIARTLQQYGCYLGDNAGRSSTLKAEQANPRRPLWRGRLGRNSLAGISWDDFVVLSRRR